MLNKTIIRQIETPLSAFEIFTLFKERPHCIFFDSAMPHDRLGRFSILTFDPGMTFSSKNGSIRIDSREGRVHLEGDPFDALRSLLQQSPVDYDGPLPFIGGAAGYFGYAMRHHVEKLERRAADDVPVPDCCFGIYDGSIVFDHGTGAVFITSAGLSDEGRRWAEDAEAVVRAAGRAYSPDSFAREEPRIVPCGVNMDKQRYLEAIGRIRRHILDGDIYQANMTLRFDAPCEISSAALYERLRRINPAPFACYYDFGEGQILSSSPERFLQIRGGLAQTRPIKGTRPRGATAAEDRANQDDLLRSEKDRAELLMIVDLSRNDLGRVCRTGSVKVPELFVLESYATVHHLVATVEGRLAEGIHPIDCVKALFPGGSITGAPKIRAMQIIDALEPTTRGVYTGSIGYIGFNGAVDFNIAIRTILRRDSRVYFQAGGGIVWDSDAEAEYAELLNKAAALMRAAGAGPVIERGSTNADVF